MNDENLDRELRAALLKDDPGPASAELRRLISAVPYETVPLRGSVNGSANRGPARSRRVSRWVASLEAVAAVALIAVIIAVSLGLRGSNAGPAASPSVSTGPSSPVPSGSFEPSRPTAAPSSPAPSSAAPSAPVTGEWRGLSWSAPGVIPDSNGINDVVSYNGGLIAVGFVPISSTDEQVAFWSSSDGTTWTRMNIDVTKFAGGAVSGLVAADVELVAWGTLGQPACTGEGEGMTCDPTPVMLWTSTDGKAWTRVADVSMFGGATITSVTFGADGFVAVGDTGWGSPAIWYSNSGTTWQRLTLPSSTFAAAHFSSVSATTYGEATVSGYFLGGATGGTAPVSGGVATASTGVAAAWWSPDGRTWTKGTVNRTGGIGTSLGSIDVGRNGMVAVGSAEGGKAAAAWTSTDGRTWQPIALGYFGAPTPAAGVPTLPGLTNRSDGNHLVAIDAGRSGLPIWSSSDGVAWQRLAFSGATDTIPSTLGNAFTVPDGLIVLGPYGSTPSVPVWHLTATG
jgi:hypothetical protein